jgi:hypothetical protein
MTIDIRYADKRTYERYIKAQPVEVVMDEFFDDQVVDPEV